MSRVVFVTQLLDPDDPVLGFSVGWIRALATRCERLVVIANEVRSVPPDLGADVFSLEKERGRGRLRRGVRYQRMLLRVARECRPEALVAHMCPVYLDLAAPIARAYSIRTLLWFAHNADHLTLRLAEQLADAVITSLPGAYPRPSPKVRVLGQAIDTDAVRFSPPPPLDGGIRLLALGRTSPAKGFAVSIRAVELLREKGLDVALRIVGPSTTRIEEAHRAELQQLIDSLGLVSAVSLEGPVPPARVPELIAGSHVLVNTMAGGTGDKVVFEAMAVGRPPLVSNPAFQSVLEGLPLTLTFTEGNEHELAARIRDVAVADAAVGERTARELRRRVERNHSIAHWADGVVRVIEEFREAERAPAASRTSDTP